MNLWKWVMNKVMQVGKSNQEVVYALNDYVLRQILGTFSSENGKLVLAFEESC